MDFFERQDHARRKTALLLFYFSAAVFSTVVLIYLVVQYGAQVLPRWDDVHRESAPFVWWNPKLFISVCSGTLLVIGCGTLYKILSLRRGGGASVAEMLGGRLISPDTSDFYERRLRNVVEEMAIASGTAVPSVYVLDREAGINAFAAGFSSNDAVVAVTQGTLLRLTRDELQGVIAHEFSHILNQDCRLNISLMGVIHGLLIIGLTGRVIIELSARGSYRRSKNSGQTVAFLVAGGIALWIIGSLGLLFTKLIKAAISRSRERLADAAAVQFTRNPDGLAGALKKIGSAGFSSRIRSSQAEQASHMFFGNGLRTSLFSTHPPVEERVRWLDSSFDGTFPKYTIDGIRTQLMQREGAPDERTEEERGRPADYYARNKEARRPDPLEAFIRPRSPEMLMATIGLPAMAHAEAASKLVQAIPQKLQQAARDPYGARMLIFYLLLDRDPTLREKQLGIVQAASDRAVFGILKQAIDESIIIPSALRLPLVDMAIPALRQLSPGQYALFQAIIQKLIDADEKTTLFEYALHRVITHHLEPVFSSKSARPIINHYVLKSLSNEVSLIFSTLARAGSKSENEAEEAFRKTVRSLSDDSALFHFLPIAQCGWKAMDRALDEANQAAPRIKKWILNGALACLMHDREITLEETELFRAIACSIGCPVPPWVTPTGGAVG